MHLIPHELHWQIHSDFNHPINQTYSPGVFTSSLSRNFFSGTALTGEYTRFLGTETSFIPHHFTFSVKQSLMQNFLGLKDRRTYQKAKHEMELTQIQLQLETLKLITDALEAYWESYKSHVQMNLNYNTLKDYEKLLKVVERKQKLSFIRPGELSGMRAEAELSLRRWKESKVQYETLMQKLLSIIRPLQKPSVRDIQDIVFKIPDTLSSPPRLSQENTDDSVKVKSLRKHLQVREKSLSISKLNLFPKIELRSSITLGSLFLLNLKSRSRALKDIPYNKKWNYYVGLHFSYPFSFKIPPWKVLTLNEKNFKAAKLALETGQEEQTRDRGILRESLKTIFQSLESAKKIRKLRKRAYQQIRKAWLQGRLTLFELVQAREAYLYSRLEVAGFLAEYHIKQTQWKILNGYYLSSRLE